MVARWSTQGVVLEVLVVKRAELVGLVGPAGSLSRRSSSRVDLFLLWSQEVMIGWLRAFCRSTTFWPSSIITLSTLRFCKGGKVAMEGGTEGPAAA